MPLQATSGAASYDAFGGGSGLVVPAYIEEVFSTWLYTGTGSAMLIQNGISLSIPNEQAYTTPGTYTWICPPGVTSVSVVCIGGGGGSRDVGNGQLLGGGGGGLGYKNNVTVTPGSGYTITVGGTTGSGGSSTFALSGTGLVGATGGSNQTPGSPLYSSSGFSGGTGGGDSIGDYSGGGGGGGAGGFTGVGGDGGNYGGSGPTSGSGGGAGGDAGSPGTGGQGVSIYGGANVSASGQTGGNYGGGGGGYQGSGGGGSGAVRIIWPGTTRQFPSTSTADPAPYTGGLVWTKVRSQSGNNALVTSSPTSVNSGTGQYLISNNSNAITTAATSITAFSGDGYQLGTSAVFNTSSQTYVSWTFKQQPKFMDVVQFTTNIIYDPDTGTPIAGGDATVSHNLQAAPGFIIVKPFGSGDWYCYHRSLGTNNYIQLNSTAASGAGYFTAVSSTSLTVTALPVWGSAYECWLFAHNAGGFGLTGTDNVISCGSMDGATGTTVTLGYEPQFIMYKASTTTGNWVMVDNMRGMTTDGADQTLTANTSNAEGGPITILAPNATGFSVKSNLTSGQTYIYIAIRRGPMKVPTVGTSVFAPVTYVGDNSTTAGQVVTSGFPVDLGFNRYKINGAGDWDAVDRLRGLTSIGVSPNSLYLNPPSTAAEGSGGYIFKATNTGVYNYGFSSANTQLNYLFGRAPSFFDVVCYTGTGSATTVTHNLGVAPEMMIVKSRGTARNWTVYHSALGAVNTIPLNLTSAASSSPNDFNSTAPTSTVFTVGTDASLNGSGTAYVNYLFATCAGVSKVGSYTGTGATQTISCGFTGGARFVLVKRTDSTGDWYMWDTARGMVSGTDPSILLNSNVVQVSANSVYTTTGGFQIVSTAAGINASGGTYIFLAIA